MTTEATDRRERISKILLTIGAIPLALLGVGLTLGGCCVGGPWLVALILWWPPPDPQTLIYTIPLLLMFPAGILFLAIYLALRRALTGARKR